jgi:transcriptional regulator with XRE-family HTH domain
MAGANSNMMEIMSGISTDESAVTTVLAARLRHLRAERGESLDALAGRSGVSRSAISMIERGTCSPTAVVLEKLATALSVPLGSLFEPAGPDRLDPVSRHDDQPSWTDPGSGYVRRAVSPPHWPSPIRIVEVAFPPGAVVAYETAEREPAIEQQVWVIDGVIEVTIGDERYRLMRGDCLAMRVDRPVTFSNPSSSSTRYAVVNVTVPIGLRRTT